MKRSDLFKSLTTKTTDELLAFVHDTRKRRTVKPVSRLKGTKQSRTSRVIKIVDKMTPEQAKKLLEMLEDA